MEKDILPFPGEPPKPILVAVVALSGDMVHADFAFCLANLGVYSTVRHHKDFRIVAFLNHKCSDVAHGRNSIVQEVRDMKAGITHILFIDSDMTFPPVTLSRLLSLRSPIVGIDACTRRPPYRRTARKREDGWDLGCGVLLIQMDVFEKVSFPWFDSHYRPDGSREGEDFAFCRKAKAAGYQPFLDEDLSARVGHLGTMEFTLAIADQANSKPK